MNLASLTLIVLAIPAGPARPARPQPAPGAQTAIRHTPCTPDQRAGVLRSLQAQVLQWAPQQVDSLVAATQGGLLEGWRLSHGHVALAGSGAVAVDNPKTAPPMPQVLLYAPSPQSSPANWLDFDGPDGPYRLVGWAYLAPFEPGSGPPALPCILPGEWFVHEAGWHLRNGGMLLTPDASTEPSRPPVEAGIYFWHPRVWDIHFWIGPHAPAVAFEYPRNPGGGLCLPEGAFYSLANGRKEPIPVCKR
jgi:hypothetical protein